MAKFRLKVNAAHPTGSINLRDAADRRITVTAGGWTPVDEISESIEKYRKYLVIEQVGVKGPDGSIIEEPFDSTVERVPGKFIKELAGAADSGDETRHKAKRKR